MEPIEVLETPRGLKIPLVPRPYCKWCTSPISPKWSKITGQCGACSKRLQATAQTLGPGGPSWDSSQLKGRRELSPYAFGRAAAVGLYVADVKDRGALGRRILDLKYQNRGGADLAEAMDLILARRFADLRFDLLIPVPPEPKPESSHNAPLVLARELASRRRCDIAQALSFDLDYRSKKQAPIAERFDATRNKIHCSAPAKVAGRSVLLVDDVLTTAGHAHWAARVLFAAGAEHVNVAVVGRTVTTAYLETIGLGGGA